MQRPLVDLVDRHPLQCDALRVTDDRLERFDDVGHDRRVRPHVAIEHTPQSLPNARRRDRCLLRGFAHRRGAGRLSLVPRPAREGPRTAVVAPPDAVLQEYAALGIHREQPCGTEPALLPGFWSTRWAS